MAFKLSDILKNRFSRKDELSKNIEIVQIFEVYKNSAKEFVPSMDKFSPISLKDGILKLAVPSAAAASELRLNESKILQKVNKNFPGREVVKKVVYKF